MFRRALLAAAASATLAIEVGHAADFSSTFFFGDSLSDAGTFAPLLSGDAGKFTTNPGTVWTENLAAALGTAARPALEGGDNFAVGGARVTQLPGVPEDNPLTANAPPIDDQISAFLALAGRADPDALYSVWGGGNDVLRAIDPAQPESADPLGYLALTAGQLADEIGRLRAAGARYVIVPNLPDLGASPFGASLGAAGTAAASGLVAAYNQTLFGDLAAAGVRVVPLDVFTLLNEVSASPGTYGLVNVGDPACGATPSLACGPSDRVAPDAAQTFLFADGVHPTTAGHRLISDYALGVLRAPAAVSLLAESPLETRAALFRTIHDLAAIASPARSPARSRLWASAGGGRLKYASGRVEPGARGDTRDLALGLDRSVTPRLTLGAALAASRVEPDFTAIGGGYRQDEQALALYATYRSGGWHASAVAAVGKLDYKTRRGVALGPALRSFAGETSGSNRSLGILAGFDVSAGALRHGPVVGLQAQRIRVDGFVEAAPGAQASSAMSFGAQKRDSRVGSLGYQIAYAGSGFTPYARLTIDREFAKRERQVDARLQTMPDNGFALPAMSPDRNYASAVAGVGVQLAPAVSAGFALAGRRGEDKVRAYGVQAVLSVDFD